MKKRDRAQIPDFSKKPAQKPGFKLTDVNKQAPPPGANPAQRSAKPPATAAKSGGQRGR